MKRQISCPRRGRRATWTGRPSSRQAVARFLVTLRLQRRDYNGLSLYFTPTNYPRILRALELVRSCDLLRWRRLRRYMPVLIEGEIGTYFSSLFGAAFIDLGDKNDWRIAGDIAHELTHAYLFARWRLPYQGALRFAHERICCVEEIRLYRRMIRALDCDPQEGARYIAQSKARHQKALEHRGWERSRLERVVRDWRLFRKNQARSRR